MKIKTLIPIATITSVVGIVTPLVTSCGGYKEYKIPTPDELDNYKFVSQKGGTMKDDDSATETYFKDVKKKRKIFVDDYIKCFGGNKEANYSEYLAIKDVKPEEGRLSTKDTFKSINNNGSTKYNEIYTYELTNVAWHVQYELATGPLPETNWNVKIKIHNVADLKKDNEWSYTFTSKKYDSEEKKYKEEKIIRNCNSTDEELQEVEEVLTKYSENMPSYYLGDTGLEID